MQIIVHQQIWEETQENGGRTVQPFATLKVTINFLVYTLLKWNYCWRREKWFSNKAYSVCEQPWVPLCLSKDSAVVKKTDSCSLSTWFRVMTLIIYLVAAMATVGEAWCMGFLTTPFSLMTHPVFRQRIQAWNTLRQQRLSGALRDALKCFSSRDYRQEEEKKKRLENVLSFLTPWINRKIGPATQKYEMNKKTEHYCCLSCKTRQHVSLFKTEMRSIL